MKPVSSGLFLAVAVGILGCSAEQSTLPEKIAAPRGKPAYVRLANLSESPASANIGNIYRDEGVLPYEMSSSRPLSPGKTFVVKVLVSGKELSIDLTTEPEKFATIVVRKSGLTIFNSSNSQSIASGGKIDYVNLTDKQVQFKVGGESYSVAPMDSINLEYPVGTIKVLLDGANSISVELGVAQVWAAYAIEQNGKLSLKSANLKGTGVAVGTGPSS